VTREYRVALLLIARDWFRPWQNLRSGRSEIDDLVDTRRDNPRRSGWVTDPKGDSWKMPCGCQGTDVRGPLCVPDKLPCAKGRHANLGHPENVAFVRRWREERGLSPREDRTNSLPSETPWKVAQPWTGRGERVTTRDLPRPKMACPVCRGTGRLVGRPAESYRLQAKQNRAAPEIELDPWTLADDFDYSAEEPVQTAYDAEETPRFFSPTGGDGLDEPQRRARRIVLECAERNVRAPLDGMPDWLRVEGSFDDLESLVAELECASGPLPRSAEGLRWLAGRMPLTIRVPKALLDLESRQRKALLEAHGNGTPAQVLRERDRLLRERRERGETIEQIRQWLKSEYGVEKSARQLRNILNGRKDRPLGVHGHNGRTKRLRQNELDRIARDIGELWYQQDRARRRIDQGLDPVASRATLGEVTPLYWRSSMRNHFAPIDIGRFSLCSKPLTTTQEGSSE
jgi:hypothetical protein